MTARAAVPAAPRLCDRVGRPAAEPGAWRRRRAGPTPAPSPELEAGWHLCKPPRVQEADSPLPSAKPHLRGPLYGTPSDL